MFITFLHQFVQHSNDTKVLLNCSHYSCSYDPIYFTVLSLLSNLAKYLSSCTLLMERFKAITEAFVLLLTTMLTEYCSSLTYCFLILDPSYLFITLLIDCIFIIFIQCTILYRRYPLILFEDPKQRSALTKSYRR